MKNRISVLDCTLRDGGYVNNWEFDNNMANGIVDLLQQAGIEFIELGIMGKTKGDRERVKFDNYSQIEPLLNNRTKQSLYTLILNYTDIKNLPEVPARSEKTVDCIRLAYFKVDWKASMEYAKILKEKGYLVFLQAMATPNYSDDELIAMIEAVNEVQPYASYMVDSFGMLLGKDIEHMANLIDNTLDKKIILGLHAHNNTQMAYSNTMTFIETVKNHDIVVDSSVYGMGRGAGNCASELICNYLKNNFNKEYNIIKFVEIYEKYLKDIFEKYYWGYSLDYYLTAIKHTNSAYAWYLKNIKNVESLLELDALLNEIPEEKRYTLFKEVADTIKENYDK